MSFEQVTNHHKRRERIGLWLAIALTLLYAISAFVAARNKAAQTERFEYYHVNHPAEVNP